MTEIDYKIALQDADLIYRDYSRLELEVARDILRYRFFGGETCISLKARLDYINERLTSRDFNIAI